MTWNAPMTAVSGSVFTSAQFNTFVRDNLAECPAAKATTPGSIFATVGTNSIVERIPTAARVDAAESTSATSWADLATVGPTVTVTTGTKALILISAEMNNTTTDSAACLAGVNISGATSETPSISYALRAESAAHGESLHMTSARLHTSLTPGVNNFRMQYEVTAGTMTANFREICVIPF